MLLPTLPQLATLGVLVALILLAKLLSFAYLGPPQLLSLQSAEDPLEGYGDVVQRDDVAGAGLVADLNL